MTDKQIKKQYIKEHVKSVKKMVKNGQVNAFIQVLASHPDIPKPILMHIDVPAADHEQKELFAKIAIPAIKEEIKDHDYKVLMVSFTSEAWIRKAKKDEVPDDYTKIPISDEVVFITFSDEDGEKFKVFDIVRNDMTVNENGELVESFEFDEDGEPIHNIELVINEELSTSKKDGSSTKSEGNFSDLYNKLK